MSSLLAANAGALDSGPASAGTRHVRDITAAPIPASTRRATPHAVPACRLNAWCRVHRDVTESAGSPPVDTSPSHAGSGMPDTHVLETFVPPLAPATLGREGCDVHRNPDTAHLGPAVASASAHVPSTHVPGWSQYSPDADAPTDPEACRASIAAASQPYAVHEITLRDTCPECGVVMQEEEVRRGWRLDEHDYTTQCNRCAHRFVARFTVCSFDASFDAAPNMTHSPRDSLVRSAVDASGVTAAAALGAGGGTDDAAQVRDGNGMCAAQGVCLQCLSPLVVHKEMMTLLRDLGASPLLRPHP